MQTKKTILFLFLTLILGTLSYYFVDQQLVWFLVAHHSRDLNVLHLMANHINNVIGAFVFLFYLYTATRIGKGHLNKITLKLIIMCNSIVIALFLKDGLKHLFGRYATATFICNNPSLIDNHVYGFNWFAPGYAFNSFPSGHATFIFSFSTSMWLLFPTLRWLWSLLAVLVIMGQIGLYYHFVSDVLAGAVLGSFVAIYNYRYWEQKR